MSNVIENRIVSLSFNNKQFEAATKKTFETLTKLKESLNFSKSSKVLSDGLGKISGSEALNQIASGVDALQNRFSTLGIVGMRVIQNLTDSMMNRLGKAVNFVSDSIISGGLRRATNIENAHFQLQALLKDEAKVQAIMDNASKSVDGTAYSYDSAAKAAAQFAASGVAAGEDMMRALRGITGVAAMTNSEYESISMIFTNVAGNGRLMGDQLLQLSGRGLNAASTIAEFFNGVNSGSIEAAESVKKAVQSVSKGTNVTEGQIREMVSKGKIDFQIFSEAMSNAFGDAAERANETFNGAFSNVKSALARIGAGFFSPLIEQNSDLILMLNAIRVKINDVKSALVFDEKNSALSGTAKQAHLTKDAMSALFDTIKQNGSLSGAELDKLAKHGANATYAIRDYMNGVNDGSIRASYAVKTAVNNISEGLEVTAEDVRRFVDEGKIDFALFTSAMETAFGDQQRALSKQFTDSFLDMISGVAKAIQNADMTKPMEIFYYWVESVKNVTKGLFSILKPLGKAFADVFLSFSADDVLDFAIALEEFTSKLHLTERGSKNLEDTFKGLFSVVKLVLDIFLGLFGVVVPVTQPIGTLNEGILFLTGSIGRSIYAFTEWIRACPLIVRGYRLVAKAVQYAMGALSYFIFHIDEFIEIVYNLPITQEIIRLLVEQFEALSAIAAPYVDDIITRVKTFKDQMKEFLPIKIKELTIEFANGIAYLGEKLKTITINDVVRMFGELEQKLKDLIALMRQNEGFDTFLTNMEQFFIDLREAFTVDNLLDRIDKVKEAFGKFFTWIKETFGPAFSGFNVGSAVAGGAGIALILGLLKAAKAFESIAGSIKSIPDLLGALGGTLKSYQKDLKASAILKISAAILVFAAAITLLSFADPKRLAVAAGALTVVAGLLIAAMAAFLDVANRTKTVNDALFQASKGLKSALKRFGAAIVIKSIGSAVKSFAEAIAIIAGTIIVIALMYGKDKGNLMQGLKIIGIIAGVLIATIAIMSLLGNRIGPGMKNFSIAALGVMMLGMSLSMAVGALKKLFDMDFPEDWGVKIAVLVGIFAGLALLSLALGSASFLSGGKKLKAGPILALAATLVITIFALEKLFNMYLPPDWIQKCLILAAIFVGLAYVTKAIGTAAGSAGGALKAAGTILAISVFIGVVVAALLILSLVPFDKMLKGAVSLGLVLAALGVSLYGAGKITEPDAYKSVLAMTFVIGVIAAALAILSMIPFTKLLPSAISLGAILGVLAADFNYISKITEIESMMAIIAMAGLLITIAISLYTLSQQPWDQMLAAGAAITGTLLAFSYALKVLSEAEDLDIVKIGLFLLATTALIPIGAALYILSMQPWSGMAAAGAAISAVVLSFALAFKLISTADGISLEKIGEFLLASLAVVPIGVALYLLSEQPWANLLGAAGALSATIIAFSLAFSLISIAKPNPLAIAAFLAGSVGIGAIAFSLHTLAEHPWTDLLSAAGAIALVLTAMTVAMGIASLLGGVAPAAISGMLLLDAFIANFALVLVALGAIFNDPAINNLLGGGASVLAQIGNALGSFVGNIIGGFLGGLTSGLVQIGEDLSSFMDSSKSFFDGLKNIDEGSTKAVKYLAEAVLTLTGASILKGLTSWFSGGGDIVKFGEELAKFGPYFASYYESIAGIDGTVVEASANAAMALAEMADKLPKTGGLKDKIFGTGTSLSAFAEELVQFGPRLKEYSESVSGLNADAVTASANAAQVMSDLANTLPNSGGLASKIMGDNSISTFGEELAKFGPYFASYAESISGINPEVVTTTANAAKALSELANGLPNSGGLVSLFTGDNSIASFGKDLQAFGEAFAAYAVSISGINSEQLSLITVEIGKLSDVAKGLNDLDSSGMTGFAANMKIMADNGITSLIEAFEGSYERASQAAKGLIDQISDSLSAGLKTASDTAKRIGMTLCDSIEIGMNLKKKSVISSVATLCKDLINEMTNDLPSDTFKLIGQNSIQAFINGILNKRPLVLTTISNLCRDYISKMKESLPGNTFYVIGQNTMQSFINGILNKKPLVLSTIAGICSDLIAEMKKSLANAIIYPIGQNTIQSLIDGMNSKKENAVEAIKSICDAIVSKVEEILKTETFYDIGKEIVNAIRDGIDERKYVAVDSAESLASAVKNAVGNGMKKSDFVDIGENAAEGLKDGIENKINKIKNAAIKAAKAAVEAAKAELKVASPSKVFIEIGSYITEGLALGILSMISSVKEAGVQISKESINPVQEAVKTINDILESGDFDSDMTITPVVDLSQVRMGANEIAKMFNQSISLPGGAYQRVISSASMFETSKNRSSNDISQKAPEIINNNYNFEQTNYSPKALSRSDIYRQTYNQFSMLKEASNRK